jgi:hypothetical protein
MRNQIAGIVGILTLACVAAPAYSRTPPIGGVGDGGGSVTLVGCGLGDITPAASDCVGWFVGDLSASTADQAEALDDLLGTPTPVTLLEAKINLGGGSGPDTIDFATPLFGTTVISAFVKAGPTVPYEGTAFYVFDAGDLVGGLDTFDINVANLDSVRLYSTGKFVSPTPPQNPVPEPASWALMLLGFGAIGAALRAAAGGRGTSLNGPARLASVRRTNLVQPGLRPE